MRKCVFLFVAILLCGFLPTTDANTSRQKTIARALYGKIQFVDRFPDYKVQIVKSFPDLKVQIVDRFPDLKVQFVDRFPGVSP